MPQDDASQPGDPGPTVRRRPRQRQFIIVASIVAALVIAGGWIAVVSASNQAEHEQALEDARAALDANNAAGDDNADARTDLVGAVER